MKILITTGVYPPESGGPATYTKLLEDRLPALGFAVQVLPFRVVRRLPMGIRHVMFFIKVLAQGRRADVIFAQDTVSVGFPSALAAQLLRKKFIVRVPGDHAWEQARQRFGVKDDLDAFQRKRYGLRVWLLRRIQRATLDMAHKAIAPSEYFAGVVRGWGIRTAVIAIYNGTDFPASIEKLDLPHPAMVSVGRLVPWKGFEFLIRLLDKLPAWRLIIVGDGPLRENLESLARDQGVFERVRFVGEVPRAQVLSYLAGADAFVLNTSFESFSFQVVEAMATRVPVITTRIGSIPELVEHTKEGVLASPDDERAFIDALESIVADPTLWQQRIEAAAKKAEKFSIDNTLRELQRLLKTV